MLAATLGAAEARWIKVSTEHFTILTPAGETVGKKWAVELEQFRRGLQAIVPVPTERLRPVTVVLFKTDRALQPYVPLEKGRPAKIGGLFVRANDINTIMLSLAGNTGDTRQVIFHEAVHWHLSAHEGVMPLWLGEGLAELYATFELPDAKSYTFGAARNDYVGQLRAGKLLPLTQLMGIGRDSLLYNEGTRASIFYAQSWAFVHYLFYGENSPGRAAVLRYLELLPVARSADDAFLAAFGGNYTELEAQLTRYIHQGSYRKYVYPRTTDDVARTLQVEPASAADLELAKGSLLLGARTAEAAEPHLQRAAGLAPADPRAWELLGHIAVGRKDFPAAAAALTRAAATGSSSYLVYHNLAVTRLPDPAIPGLPNATFDPHVMDTAAADYRHAIRLAPNHVPSYEGLAGLMHGMATFAPGDIDLLLRGRLQAPGSSMIEAGIAAGELRSGRTAEGLARLERLCERNPDTHDAGMIFARQILVGETLRAEIDRINELGRENRFAEVVAIADGALARGLEPAQRQMMLDLRRRSEDFQKITDAVTLANQGDVTGARERIEQLLATNPERSAAMDARRLLREMARQEERARERN
jgi:tetratricopeptide (TPR) repeat protein